MPCKPLRARNTVSLSCTDASVMMIAGALSVALSSCPDGICRCTFCTCTRLATFNLSSNYVCTNSISCFEVSPLLMVNPVTRMFASLHCSRYSNANTGRNECWEVLTFSTRTFKVFIPILRVRIRGFHIQ